MARTSHLLTLLTFLICFRHGSVGAFEINVFHCQTPVSYATRTPLGLGVHAADSTGGMYYSKYTVASRSNIWRQFDWHPRRGSTIVSAVKFRNFDEMLDVFNDVPVLVDFHATWCGPCKLMKKELECVRGVLGERVKVFHIDTEKFPALGARFNIRGLPTAVLFKGGRVVYRIEGVATADDILKQLSPYMSDAPTS